MPRYFFNEKTVCLYFDKKVRHRIDPAPRTLIYPYISKIISRFDGLDISICIAVLSKLSRICCGFVDFGKMTLPA